MTHKLVPIEPTQDMLDEASFAFREAIKNTSGMQTLKVEDARVIEYKAMLSAAPSPWLPIESAPKDGTQILCFKRLCDGNPCEDNCAIWVNWFTDFWGWNGNEYEYPSHWIPLPPAPEVV